MALNFIIESLQNSLQTATFEKIYLKTVSCLEQWGPWYSDIIYGFLSYLSLLYHFGPHFSRQKVALWFENTANLDFQKSATQNATYSVGIFLSFFYFIVFSNHGWK